MDKRPELFNTTSEALSVISPDLLPLRIESRPSYASLVEAGQTYEVRPGHGTTIDAARAMMHFFIDHGVDPTPALPTALREHSIGLLTTTGNGVDTALTLGRATSDVAKIGKRILTRLSPYVPEGLELPPILVPPGQSPLLLPQNGLAKPGVNSVGDTQEASSPPTDMVIEIHELLIKHFMRQTADSTGIGLRALQSFLNGKLTSQSPNIYKALAKHIGLPPEKAAEYEARYAQYDQHKWRRRKKRRQ